MSHRRTGKIARLPAEIREEVNEMISAGVEYPHIADWLAEHGHPGFIPMNISRWRDGGYEEWLKHQERLEQMEAKTAYAVELAQSSDGAKFQEATLNLTAIQFFEVLNRFDPAKLASTLETRPEKFPALINSLAKLTREVTGLKRYQDHQREKAEAKADENRPALDGMSDETFQKILQELRLRIIKELNLSTQPVTPTVTPDNGN
jgi:hypothetical protein